MSRSLQERFESTGLGRAVISGFLLFVVAALIVWNIPASNLKQVTLRGVRPVVTAIGLEQIWSVFAPEPRNHSVDLRAEITYADGSVSTWRWPIQTEPFLSVYPASRWEKWQDNVRLNRHRELWPATAAWVARIHQKHGVPVEVTLIRRASFLLPPGPGPNHTPWEEYAFFTLQVSPAVLRGDGVALEMWSL